MIKYADGELINLLPTYFSEDTDIISLSYALKRGMSQLIAFSKVISVYSNIQILPENLLDYLALELNVSYYSTEYLVPRKREIIENSIQIKMRAGTKHAVEELCESIFGSSEIVEWFDFKDKPVPGQFDVEITSGQEMNEMFFNRFSLLIEQIKNASSHIRHINTRSPVVFDRMLSAEMWSSPHNVIKTITDL